MSAREPKSRVSRGRFNSNSWPLGPVQRFLTTRSIFLKSRSCCFCALWSCPSLLSNNNDNKIASLSQPVKGAPKSTLIYLRALSCAWREFNDFTPFIYLQALTVVIGYTNYFGFEFTAVQLQHRIPSYIRMFIVCKSTSKKQQDIISCLSSRSRSRRVSGEQSILRRCFMYEHYKFQRKKEKKGIKTTHTAVTREATEGNKDIESKLIYSNKYLT